MSFIQNLGVRAKIWILMSVAITVTLILGIASFWSLYNSLLSANQTKTSQLVDMAYAVMETHEQQVIEGKISREDVQKEVAEIIGAMRYGNGDYFWIHDVNLKMVMHPIKPEMNGKDLSKSEDPTGKKLFVEMNETVKKNNGAGFVNYMWARKKDVSPEAKISYVKEFKPWGWVVGTGVYLKDIQAEMWAQAKSMAVFMGVIMGGGLLAMFLISSIIGRNIQHGIGELLKVFKAMASYDLRTRSEIEGNDEVATACRGLNGVLENLGKMVGEVRASADQLAAAANELSSTTDTSRQVSTEQQSDIRELSHATEESASTLADINQRIGNARAKVSDITGAAGQADESMARLKGMAGKVAEASGVINDISDQINLLALNAAIEAARAGDAGRGFAVVADEVRKLAGSTSSSAQQIGEVMSELQKEVGDTSAELQRIVQAIRGINDDVGLVAGAMGQQTAALNEIASGVNAFGTRVERMNTSVGETSEAAASVASEAQRLTDGMNRFQT